ncbi:MAG: type II secretion system F family protein [Planctomycetia bacterium]|nr:MAG: type II secretion system F family protein [Planctomycetia bacterium]
MSVFTYEALNDTGQEVKGEIEAPSKEEAVAKVRGLKYFPTKVVEKVDKKKAGIRKDVGGAGARKKAAGTGLGWVNKKALTTFTRQLSTLQDAGLPILRSIRILEHQQKPGMLRASLKDVCEDVEGGMTLSEAMARHPKAFDRLYTNMVAAGEAGGVLDVILQRLADFMEKSQRLKRKVIGAMIYPAVVITIAMTITMLIVIFLVPQFRTIFKDFGATLPAITLFLIAISDWMVGANGGMPGFVWILLLPVVLVLGLKLIRSGQTGRLILDTLTMKIPVLGKIISKSGVSRFTRTLGTLISAGVPILEAIKIAKDTSGNEVYAGMLARVHESIREGDSFANPLRASKTVDAIVVNMVDVGEETGELDKMLMKVADNYDDEVDTLVASLVSLLEPVLVIVLGSIVGFIVIALYMPMISLINSLTQQ